MRVWCSEISITALADRTMPVLAFCIDKLGMVSAFITAHKSNWNKNKKIISSS